MTLPVDYYEDSYPPELWATPAAPVGAAQSAPGEETPAATPAVAAGAPAPATEVGIVTTADGAEHVGILPATAATLTVAAGTPGSYVPDLKASARPRNITELRERATATLPADPWSPGQYVLVGENGKRAHWDGETWQYGEAPALTSGSATGTVPDGTVPPA